MASPDEVETARRALASLNPNDEAYFVALNELGHELMSRFTFSRDSSDLDESISITKQVLDFAPPGHSFHAAALGNMGQALNTRFKLFGDARDLAEAVSYFEAAVASCTPEQPFYLAFVGNLASGLLNRYRIYGDVTDLDRVVETGTTALSISRSKSSGRDALLNNLANAFKERFAKQGNKADLDSAFAHYEACLELRPPGHPSRHSVLGNLADGMLVRFEVEGHLQYLEKAANYYVSALQLRSPGQEGYLLYLTSLGVVYWRIFNVDGKVESLDVAFGCYRTAMEHSKVPNLDHSRLLDNYGAALSSRYTLLGNTEDLDQAIEYLTTSSNILPSTYHGRFITIHNLGLALVNRFNATNSIADLNSSIENLAVAVQLCTPGHHLRPSILSAYASALSTRFKASGDVQDLHLATSTSKDALALSSPTDPNYSLTVSILATTLLDCFHRWGNIKECQNIIEHCDRALRSTQPEEVAFVPLKMSRANAFLHKFKFGREEKDIDTCIAAFREIIYAVPEGRAEYVNLHLFFGIALQTRFKLSGDAKDLDECLTLYRIAHRACKRGNSHYASVCMQFGAALCESYEYRFDADALDEAVMLLAEAEEKFSPIPNQVDYKPSLVNLANAFFVRFQSQRNRDDLDAAIEHVSRALTLPALDEEFLVSLALGTSLFVRYLQDGEIKDLERSVELFAVTAEQMPRKHVVREVLCRNYGDALVRLAPHREHLQYLNAGIDFFKEAIEHLPASHYDQPETHACLAQALYERARLLRDSDGLHEPIKIIRAVIQTLPEDSPMLQSLYHRAGRICLSMYELSELQLTSFMEEGFRYYEKAGQYTYTHSFMSVYTALEWVEYAEMLHHESALLAYQTSLSGLYRHLLGTASIKGRHAVLLTKHWAARRAALPTDATSCAIARGELRLAVELSEQGRGLLWSQLSQSRTPVDALRSSGDVGHALASDFERVSTRLAQTTVMSEVHTPMTASRLTVEEAALRYRQLSKELDDIIARIRQQDGFQSFLVRPSFESLQSAAIGGPVILVNVSRRRCDAIIVLHNAPPRLVPLPDTSLEELTTLSARFYRMLQMTSRVGEEKMREREVAVVLRTLWDTIVRPIVDELTPSTPRGSRIWWCPTSKLTTLPLHAAGPYRKGSLNLPNIYISSYTPTLAALIRARHRPSPSSSSDPPAFVAIGQAKPASSTGPALQTVSTELSLVQSLLPHSPPQTCSFSALDGEASTGDAVLAALATHGWAHIACHGYPNVARPFDAAFALSDRLVTVLDIVRARGIAGAGESIATTVLTATTPGEFAFLSACHTAVGDREAPDEIVHLAAAMQFVGFRSVIGTMWAVDDGMARYMVRTFYERMFAGDGDGDGDVWDCTRAARALNKAAKSVDKDVVSLDQRIVFIHIGA